MTPTATFTPTPTAQDVEIGYGKTFYTLDDAWRGLSSESGRVRILLDGIDQLEGIILIPEDRGITELILDSVNKHSVHCPDARLYANGIPLVTGNFTLKFLLNVAWNLFFLIGISNADGGFLTVVRFPHLQDP